MFTVEVDALINSIIETYHRFGFCHRGDEATVRETIIKLFYSIYYFVFMISLMSGGYISEDIDESIFLFEAGIIALVVLAKLFYLIWKKKEVLELLNWICVYSIEDHGQFNLVNEKLKSFRKLLTVAIFLLYVTNSCMSLIVPFVGSEKKVFVNFGFPMDYTNNEVGFWLAFTFFATEMVVTSFGMMFHALTWYVMFNCSLRYEILGHRIQTMGVIRTEDTNAQEISDIEKQNLFYRDLVTAIELHKEIKNSTSQLNSFVSTLFAIQIFTAGFCICGSIYSLAFNLSANFVEYLMYTVVLLYNIFDVFMIMNLGNKIETSSNQLSCFLFESDWIDQPQSTKKLIILFGELLQQPHKLIILKLYPLSLKTFTQILTSAYNMFAFLQNVK